MTLSPRLRRIATLLFALGALSVPAGAQTADEGFAFPPLFVLGLSADYLQPVASDSAEARFEIGPSLALSWRRALAAGAYLALDGRAELSTALSAWEPTDAQSLAAELALPVGEDEIVVAARVASRLTAEGILRPELDARWSAAYRLITPRGWIALVSPGRVRREAETAGDSFGQRVGVATLAAPTFRLERRTSVDVGFERFPEQDAVDEEGEETGSARSDLVINAGTEIAGLLGFFTSWRADASTTVRSSSRADASRVEIEVAGSISTSPTSTIGLSAAVVTAHELYRSLPALDDSGDALAESLRVTRASARLGADFAPLERLFLLASVDAALMATNDASPTAWALVIRAGVEYTF